MTGRQEYSKDLVVECVAEFIEAVVHSVLYHRGVYPASSFERRQLYGLDIPLNRHPKVVEYISQAIERVKILLGDQAALDLRIPIMRGEQREMREVYCLVMSSGHGEGVLNDSESNNVEVEVRRRWYRMYDDFRAILLRIQSVSCSDEMADVSKDHDGVTFCVQIRAAGSRELFREWMVVDRGEDNGLLTNTRAIPLPVAHIPLFSQEFGQSIHHMDTLIHVFTQEENEQ